MNGRRAWVLGLTSLLFGAQLAWADCEPFKERDGDKTIKQGEFAVLLAQALDVKRPEKWTCKDAIDALSDKEVDIVPDDGWKMDEDLEEGVMVAIVRRSGLQISTVPSSRRTTSPGRRPRWSWPSCRDSW
jgi:hypothetical protein